MVDFHTHILPNIDDGSDSIETSAWMLARIKEQGINTVFATPHFYPVNTDIESFCLNRQKALAEISPFLDGLTVIPAAEVKYCRNISRYDGLVRVGLGDSGYILLEMTYNEWTKQMADDVISIMDNIGMIPVLAHVDRYWDRSTVQLFDRMLDAGVLMQLNVSALSRLWNRNRFLRLIGEGKIHLLGSDCHNTTSRIPNLKYGFDILEKHGYVAIIEENEEMILDSKMNILSSKAITRGVEV